MKSCVPTSKTPTGNALITIKMYQYSTDPDATIHIDIEEDAKLKRHHYHNVKKLAVNDARDISELPTMQISKEFAQTIAPNITDYQRISCQFNDEEVQTYTFPITTKYLNDFITSCEEKIRDSLENLNPRYTCRK